MDYQELIRLSTKGVEQTLENLALTTLDKISTNLIEKSSDIYDALKALTYAKSSLIIAMDPLLNESSDAQDLCTKYVDECTKNLNSKKSSLKEVINHFDSFMRNTEKVSQVSIKDQAMFINYVNSLRNLT